MKSLIRNCSTSGVGCTNAFHRRTTIRAAWQIVALGQEQWEQTRSIKPKHLAKVRKVQIETAHHLASFKDGPAVLVRAASYATSSKWRASELISLSDQHATLRASGPDRR
jgi:hypothetical protein